MHNEFIGIEVNVKLLDSQPKVPKLEHRQIFENLEKKNPHTSTITNVGTKPTIPLHTTMFIPSDDILHFAT